MTGRDKWFAAWLPGRDGTIGVSKARKAGDRIQIQQGSLKDLAGFIICIDKSSARTHVAIQIAH